MMMADMDYPEENRMALKKSPKFSEAEMQVIIEGIREYKTIIANSDKNYSTRKTAIFKKITDRVNTIAKVESTGPLPTERQWKQIRKKWFSLRQSAMKLHRIKVQGDSLSSLQEERPYIREVLDIILEVNKTQLPEVVGFVDSTVGDITDDEKRSGTWLHDRTFENNNDCCFSSSPSTCSVKHELTADDSGNKTAERLSDCDETVSVGSSRNQDSVPQTSLLGFQTQEGIDTQTAQGEDGHFPVQLSDVEIVGLLAEISLHLEAASGREAGRLKPDQWQMITDKVNMCSKGGTGSVRSWQEVCDTFQTLKKTALASRHDQKTVSEDSGYEVAYSKFHETVLDILENNSIIEERVALQNIQHSGLPKDLCEEELECLLAEIDKFKGMLLAAASSHGSDTGRQQNVAWRVVTEQVNACRARPLRWTVEQLQHKWKELRQEAERHSTDISHENRAADSTAQRNLKLTSLLSFQSKSCHLTHTQSASEFKGTTNTQTINAAKSSMNTFASEPLMVGQVNVCDHVGDSENDGRTVHPQPQRKKQYKLRENVSRKTSKILFELSDDDDIDNEVFQKKKGKLFTTRELDIMLSLYEANHEIINTKKMDSESVIKKQQVVQCMVKQMNSHGGGKYPRTMHQVYSKLQNLRREALQWRRDCDKRHSSGLVEVGEERHSLEQPLWDRLLSLVDMDSQGVGGENFEQHEEGEDDADAGKEFSAGKREDVSTVIQKHLESLVDICGQLRKVGVEAGTMLFEGDAVMCCGTPRLRHLTQHPLLAQVLADLATTEADDSQCKDQWTVRMLNASSPISPTHPLTSPNLPQTRSLTSPTLPQRHSSPTIPPTEHTDSQQTSENVTVFSPSPAATLDESMEARTVEPSADQTATLEVAEMTLGEPLTLTAVSEGEVVESILEDDLSDGQLEEGLLGLDGEDGVGNDGGYTEDRDHLKNGWKAAEAGKAAAVKPAPKQWQAMTTTSPMGITWQPGRPSATATPSITPPVHFVCQTCSAIFQQLSSFMRHVQGCRLQGGGGEGDRNREGGVPLEIKKEDSSVGESVRQWRRGEEEEEGTKRMNPFVVLHKLPPSMIDGILSGRQSSPKKAGSQRYRHECQFCGRKFPDPAHRIEHERIHTGERPFPCDLCGKSFTRRYHQKVHRSRCRGKSDVPSVETATGESLVESQSHQHECQFCGRKFPDAAHRKEHERIHTGEKPFACERCGKSFSRRHYQKVHMGRCRNRGHNPPAETRAREGPQTDAETCRVTTVLDNGSADDQMTGADADSDHESPWQAGKDSTHQPIDASPPAGTAGFSSQNRAASSFKQLAGKQNGVTRLRPGQHACRFCGRRFYKPCDCRRHERSHTGERPYQCDQCGKAFACRKSLRLHRLQHADPSSHVCEVCQRQFYHLQGLLQHMRSSHGVAVPATEHSQLPMAGTEASATLSDTAGQGSGVRADDDAESTRQAGRETAPVEDAASWHDALTDLTADGGDAKPSAALAVNGGRVSSPKPRRHACQFCGRRFVRFADCKSHESLHTGDKPFQCDQCGKTFARKMGLKVHQTRHSERGSHTCQECGHSFNHVYDLRSHLKTRHGVVVRMPSEPQHSKEAEDAPDPFAQLEKRTCKECGKVLPNAGTLIWHMKTHQQKATYVCHVCQKRLPDKRRYRSHLERHLGLRKFQCEICGTKFTFKGSLNVHMRYHTGKPYRCEYCGEAFSSNSHLTVHRRTHTGERPFLCDICGASFTQGGRLTVHRRRHTGEKPYHCEDCGERFQSTQRLMIHRRKHTGIEPYTCHVCGKAFQTASHRNVHVRLHTGERPYSCEVCGEQFHRPDVMRLHRKKHGHGELSAPAAPPPPSQPQPQPPLPARKAASAKPAKPSDPRDTRKIICSTPRTLRLAVQQPASLGPGQRETSNVKADPDASESGPPLERRQEGKGVTQVHSGMPSVLASNTIVSEDRALADLASLGGQGL